MKYRLTDTTDRKGTHLIATLDLLVAQLREWSLDWTPIHRRWLEGLISQLRNDEPIHPDLCAGIGVRIEVVHPFVVEVHRTEYIAYEVWATDEETAGDRYSADGDEVASDIVSEEFMGITEGTRDVLDR